MHRIPPLAAFVLFASTLSAQNVLVAPSGAFATIQSAIAAAQPGDVIEVPPGTYSESLDTLGKAITLRAQQGPSVTFLTGPQRRIEARSGETTNTVVEGFAFTGQLGGNWSAVEVTTAGLTIRNFVFDSLSMAAPARVNGSAAPAIGARAADLMIESCVFENCVGAKAADSNMAPFPVTGADGGAIGAIGGQLKIVASIFRNNRAGDGGSDLGGSFSFSVGSRGGNGGALAAMGTDVEVVGCRFEGNRAGNGGADQSPFPQLLAGAAGNGGAIHVSTAAANPVMLTVVDSVFFGNSSGAQASAPTNVAGAGGAIMAVGVATRLESSLFHLNEAHLGGGVMHAEATGDLATPALELVNCILVNNTAIGLGGALHVRLGDDADVMHCVFFGNGAGDGAAVWLEGGAVGGLRVSNSILVGSFGPDFGSLEGPGTLAAVFEHDLSDQPLPAGVGNLLGDPLFVSPPDLDFHLLPESPCIDAGVVLATSPTLDWDGESRPFGAAPDIGADEHVSQVPVDPCGRGGRGDSHRRRDDSGRQRGQGRSGSGREFDRRQTPSHRPPDRQRGNVSGRRHADGSACRSTPDRRAARRSRHR